MIIITLCGVVGITPDCNVKLSSVGHRFDSGRRDFFCALLLGLIFCIGWRRSDENACSHFRRSLDPGLQAQEIPVEFISKVAAYGQWE